MNKIFASLHEKKPYSAKDLHPEPILGKFRRKLLIITGPVIYLTLALLPWFKQEERFTTFSSLSSWQNLPMSEKLSSFTQEKRYQVGKFKLQVDTKTVKLNNDLSGLQSTSLQYEDLNLLWTKNQPLILVMPDGRTQESLPTNYWSQDDGFILEFSEQLQLSFHASNTGLKVDLLWPNSKEMPSEVRLPWNEELNRKQQNGDQLSVSSDNSQPMSYLSSFTPVSTSTRNYLGIQLQYFAFLEASNTNSSPTTAQENQEKQNDTLLKTVSALDLHRIPLLWQESQPQSHNTSQNLYKRLYQAFYSSMLYKMNDLIMREDIPSPEWIALYLKLILEQNAPLQSETNVRVPEWLQAKLPNYEEIRLKMQAFTKSKSWNSMALIPYLGIDRSAFAQEIQRKGTQLNQIQSSYNAGNLSFSGQSNLAQLLFDYGYLDLLLRITKYAVKLQEQLQEQEISLDTPEQFYLLAFLWQAASKYPRNGVITLQDTRQQFRSWLAEHTHSWLENGFPEGSSVRFILDLLQVLWDDKLQVQEQAYSLATQLFRMMDSQGNLPQIYQRENNPIQLLAPEDRIPYLEVWQYMTKAKLLPRDITVVPGLWVWSTGRADVTYFPNQPILATVNTFPAAQGNKLLLLRGVYFRPDKVLMNDEPVKPVRQMPKPQLGNPAAWYYDPQNRYLAIEIPATKQQTIHLNIE